MLTAKRGFWFSLLANCVYTIAPAWYIYAGLTGNTWTKLGQHVTPTLSGKVLCILIGLGFEVALFFHWRKWWREDAPRT